MRVVLLVLIVLWPATAPARWVGTAEQWADLQSRDGYGDMDIWFNSLSSKKAGSCCSNFDGRPPETIVQTSDHHYQVMLEGQWVDVPDEAMGLVKILGRLRDAPGSHVVCASGDWAIRKRVDL